MTRIVDVLAAIRSSRFDRPLSYDAADLDLALGDVVRVPLGSREVLAYVVTPVREEVAPMQLRTVNARLDVPRAFDATGLHLAQFVAEHYLCTLGDALRAVTLASALPRMRDVLVRGDPPRHKPSAAMPGRLVRLIWEELEERFPLETLLRHPEARRCGDRATLLRYVGTLIRSGALLRERRFERPSAREYRIDVLEPGDRPIKGRKAEALVAFVRAQPGVPRADALLAGFSNAVIARALRAEAILQHRIAPARLRARSIAAPPFPPTAEQSAALDQIAALLDARRFESLLLEGVTGSGKTYVYVEAMKRVVRAGGRAIVLVPEISLTPQTAQRFEAAFGERVAVLHSALSERERFDAFQACARGEIDVVVGARSAVFAPLSNVRLLVVDESHDPSYKQDSVPRYHAIAVARERMRRAGGVLMLGSATPSLESYAAVRSGALASIQLRARATAQPLPKVRIVDLAQEFRDGNRRIFGSHLIGALGERLARGEKSVLFVNRRGSGGFMLCRACGGVPGCPRCSVSLSAHRGEGLLRCHYCDFQTTLPQRCPTCGAETIAEYGIGTERVVSTLEELFPQARVVRMDSDTTTRVGDHARLLDRFEREGDVLVGTQMVAKGLDFPSVTLVGVVAADLGLHFPDFRAGERTFALIAQACGRSGRSHPGEAIVQTYVPEHPAVRFAAEHDYRGFAQTELAEREAAGFPPAARLVYLGVIARNRTLAHETAQRYAEIVAATGAADVLGPAPYPIARVNDEWRFRIGLRTQRARALREIIRAHVLPLARTDRATRLAINVDP